MNFEDLQSAWRSQGAGAKIIINADLLLKEVRRNQQQFHATIFRRDVQEVGTAAVCAIFFLYVGLKHHEWTWYLLALACFGVGTFMVVDRWWQNRKKPSTNDPLKACIQCSLHQVRHQIWLLKNILWWYLLPIAVALGVSTSADIWHSRHVVSVVIGWGVYVILGTLLYWGIYRLNQLAVRNDLEPRRQELEALLASLQP